MSESEPTAMWGNRSPDILLRNLRTAATAIRPMSCHQRDPPIGSPIIGWVADRFGPRWALGIGAASGFAAAVVGLRYLTKYRGLRISLDAGRLHFSMDEPAPDSGRSARATV